jgi:hypothetical protein
MKTNSFKKLALAFIFVFTFIIASHTSSTSAASNIGNFYESPQEVWKSSACTTGYPWMVFDIYSNGAYGYATIERYSNGSWNPLSSTTQALTGERTTIKIAAFSSTTQYRVSLKNVSTTILKGYVSCSGSW